MAGSAASTRAGGAYVEIMGKDDALARVLRRAEARVRAFGASVQAVGRTIAGIGVVVAAPFALSAKTFASFEQAMARVKAITNASEGDFGRLSEEAKRLGRDTVFSAKDAADAMGNFAQAGFSVNEILKATGPALDLAATAQIGIAESADIASKIMRGMGVRAEELSGVVDVLAKAATTANAPIATLGEAFKFVGPIAKVAGISLGEITAAIQLLSNAGIQGEVAGTTLRGMILSLTSPSKEAADELTRLGIRVNDERGNFVGLVSVVGQLQKVLAGVGSGKRLESLGKVFPARSAAGVAELVSQGGAALADATQKLGNSSGTAARIAKTQLDTLYGAWKLLESSLEGLAIEVGAAVMPMLRRWGATLVEVANTLALLVKNNRGAIASVAKGAVVVAGIGAAMYAAGAAAKLLAVGIGVLRGAAIVAVAAINTLKVATIALGVAASVSTALTGLAAAAATLLTPVGLINAAFIAGAAALGYWLVTSGNASAALGALGRGFADLKGVAVEAFGGIAAALKSGDIAAAGRILWAALKLEWAKGVAYLASLTAPLERAWIDAWTTIKSAGVQAMASLQGAWLVSVYAIREAWATLATTLTTTWNSVAGFFAASFAFVAKLFEPVVYAVQALWGATMVYLRAEWAVFSASFRATWAVLLSGWGVTTKIIGGLWSATTAIMKAEWAVVSASFQATMKVLGPIGKLTFGIIAAEVGVVVAVLKAAVDLIAALYKGLYRFLGLEAAFAAFGKVLGETKEKNRGVRAGAEADRQARQGALAGDLAGIDAEKRRRFAELKAGGEAGKAGLDDRAAGLDAQVAAARKEFEDALAAAKAPGADAEARDFLGQLDQRLVDATAANREGRGAGAITPEGLDAGMAEARKGVGVDVAGTFSASAIRGLGAGESVTDAVKDNNKELKKINDRLRKAGPLVFNEP
jgi:TP901 family phage tail tape measure protein